LTEGATGRGSEFSDKEALVDPPDLIAPPAPPPNLAAFELGVAVGVTRRGVLTAGDAAAEGGPEEEGRGGRAVDTTRGPGCCLDSSLLLRERACIVLDSETCVFRNASESGRVPPPPLPLRTLVAGDVLRDTACEGGRTADEARPPGSDTLEEAKGFAGLASTAAAGVDEVGEILDDSEAEGVLNRSRLLGFRCTEDKFIVATDGEGEGVRERALILQLFNS